MSELISGYGEWALFMLSAFIIGMSKTGMQGAGTLVVPILALMFGAKPSTGIILPMLCFADIIAVVYYRRSCEWKLIIKLIPMAVVGFFVAIIVDRYIAADKFRILMAISIFIGLAIMYWSEKSDKDQLAKKIKYAAPFFGLLGGFTTMIGNAAGPIMSVYLLLMKLPKYAFVGTAAWFFLIVNYLKLPLQAFVWNNINGQTLLLDLAAIPAIILGAVAGIYVVKILPEKLYRKVIIYLTIVSTILMLW